MTSARGRELFNIKCGQLLQLGLVDFEVLATRDGGLAIIEEGVGETAQ